MLEADAAALRVAREVTEMAPPGIAYLTLRHARAGAVCQPERAGAAGGVGEGLLGRYAVRVWVGMGVELGMVCPQAFTHPAITNQPTIRPFNDLVHFDDLDLWHERLAVLVLSKNPHFSSGLRFRICACENNHRLVDARFRFGAFGVACSLWLL